MSRKTTVDAPPTLPLPEPVKVKREKSNTTIAHPEHKAIKVKKEQKQAFRLVVGSRGKDNVIAFVKDGFDELPEMLSAFKKVVEHKHGKGLLEVIMVFKG